MLTPPQKSYNQTGSTLSLKGLWVGDRERGNRKPPMLSYLFSTSQTGFNLKILLLTFLKSQN